MIARVLLVGDELLGGAASDRNTATAAVALGARGVPVVGAEVVGDDEATIASAIRRLAAESDVLVVTGGLGPTEDDRTREALAAAMDVPIREDAVARSWIEARYDERKLPRAEASIARQARIPEGAEPVPNPYGTAPGVRARVGGCRVWLLPGVPPEVEGMIGQVAAELGVLPVGHGWERIVATLGIGEVRVEERLQETGFRTPPGVRLAFLPGAGGVRLRLSAPEGAPDEVLDASERGIRERIGDWALPETSLAASLVARFREFGLTLATAESCTGGLIGDVLTNRAGSSAYFMGGVISYSNDIKQRVLGVRSETLAAQGAVSESCALEMARGVRKALDVDVGISATGIAGPGGGGDDKPVGLVYIGLSTPAVEIVSRNVWPHDRVGNKQATVDEALRLLMAHLTRA